MERQSMSSNLQILGAENHTDMNIEKYWTIIWQAS